MKCKLNLELEDDSVAELRICFIKHGEAIVQPVYNQIIPVGNVPVATANNQDTFPQETTAKDKKSLDPPKDDIPPEMMMEF